MVNLLITSAGSTVGTNLITSLREKGRYRIIAVDADPLAPGLYLAHQRYVVPRADDPGYLAALIEICRTQEVQVLLPGHSAELPVLSRNRDILFQTGVRLAIAEPGVIEVLSDKRRMAEDLRGKGFDVPRELDPVDADLLRYPVFVKSRFGSGSHGAVMVATPVQLRAVLSSLGTAIVQEYIGGAEYTVDVLSDLNGKVLMTSPRKRLRVRDGICTKGITVDDPRLSELVSRCVESFPIPGVSNVQVKVDGSRYCIIEVNPRFSAGGLPLTVGAGLDIPDILVRMLLGEAYTVHRPVPGTVMMRYWHSVVVREAEVRGTGSRSLRSLCL